MQINITDSVVRHSDGSLDLEATLEALSPKVVALVEKLDSDSLDIGNAVHAVFDMFKGSRMNTNAVVSFALQNLQVTPESAGELTSKIQEFIKLNSGEQGSSLFSTKRGRNGGVARWSDVKDE